MRSAVPVAAIVPVFPSIVRIPALHRDHYGIAFRFGRPKKRSNMQGWLTLASKSTRWTDRDMAVDDRDPASAVTNCCSGRAQQYRSNPGSVC